MTKFYCVLQVEVFNLLLVMEQDGKFIVQCLGCARRLSADLQRFVVLNQYKMAELADVYDHFQLGVMVRLTASRGHHVTTLYFILAYGVNDTLRRVFYRPHQIFVNCMVF